jgi:ubiquinone/menaquinone biosynthesis C-methylase UbiE
MTVLGTISANQTVTEAAAANNPRSIGLISLYRRRAKRYDRSSLLLYFAGFRHWAYRKRAVLSLALNPGDTVVDIGCGTGLNFSLLQGHVGPRGRIIGVDLTDAMLNEANDRVAAHGWSNVELVKSDAATYVFPPSVDGILSTFALTLVPEFDQVVRNGALALPPGKRFVILDFKRPSGWFMDKAAPLLAKLLTGPFGGTIEMASRKPWQSLEKHLALIQFTNLYFGGAYIAAGEKTSFSGSDSRTANLR